MSRTEWQAALAMPVTQDQDHIQGRADAPVTIVQYGDYECLYSGAAYSIIKDVQTRMSERLRFVFRNFPITSHPHAQQAAEAAEAATIQGRFWEMHDLLFENQRHLRDDTSAAIPRSSGRCRAVRQGAGRARPRGASQRRLPERRAERRERHPTFYINGVRQDDSYEIGPLLAAVERAAAPEHETG